ncbi:MAG: hypothetical protein MI808_13630 [Pseudomonadales bacterium]|nr:hypothetical protein [Pseudomonadales bacterium]
MNQAQVPTQGDAVQVIALALPTDSRQSRKAVPPSQQKKQRSRSLARARMRARR